MKKAMGTKKKSAAIPKTAKSKKPAVKKNTAGRKRAEESFRASESLFRAMAENYPNSYISIIEKDLTVGYTAGQEFKKLNLDPNQFVGLALEQVFGEHTPLVRENYLKTFDGAETQFELFINDQYQLYRTVPLADQDGRVTRILAVVENVTERKQMENALRASELKYRSLIESSSDTIFCVDEKGQYQFTNQLFASTFGKTADYFIGKTFWDIYPKEHADYRFAATTRVFQTGESESLDVEVPLPDRTLFFYATANPVKDETGKVILVLTHAVDITERKRVEEALRASEEKYRVLFDVFPLGITIANKDGEISESNREAERLLGLSKEEQERRTIDGPEWKIIRPDGSIMPSEEYASVRALKENRLIENVEMGIVKGNGIVTWINVTATPLGDHEVVITYQDITERRRVKDALQKSEERYRLLFNGMTEGFALHELIFDENGKPCDYRFLDINPAFERLTGLKREDIIGKGQREVLPTDDPFWFETYSKVALTGESIHLENYSPPLQRHYEVNAYCPAPNQFAVIFKDITERKQAEEALHETNAYLENLINYANAPIIVWDPQFRITRFNHAFEFLTGRTEADVLGQSLEMLFPPALVEDSMALIRKTLTGERWETVEIKILHQDESIRTVLWNSATLFSGGDKTPIATIAQGQDITDRKRAEEEIKKLNASLEQRVAERTAQLEETQEQLVRNEKLTVLGQMAGSVGHELRNPLGVMSNAIYFLKMVQPDASDKIKEYLDLVEKNIRISDKIVTDLLDFTRIKSVDREPISIPRLIQQTLERFPAPESVQVQLDLPVDFPQAYADPQHVMQILGNFILNAYQAMPEGGQLSIIGDRSLVLSPVEGSVKTDPLITDTSTAFSTGSWLLITVKDTGVGISPANLKKLFEPLFTTKSRGIGLGLAVCKKLAEANGSRIEVESEVGKGSTFSIYLPVYVTTT